MYYISEEEEEEQLCVMEMCPVKSTNNIIHIYKSQKVRDRQISKVVVPVLDSNNPKKTVPWAYLLRDNNTMKMTSIYRICIYVQIEYERVTVSKKNYENTLNQR